MTMVTEYKNFEQMVESAQKAIDGPYYTQYAEWLQSLLDILKEGKYATIQAKNGTFLDVSKIANTHDYASFFDVVNQINRFDTTIEPKVTGKLKNKYFSFCIPQFF